MRAAIRSEYGGPDVVRFVDLPDPEPKADELLVRVHATTVNRTDCACRSGKPWINAAVCGWPRPRVKVLGSEYAGVVEAVGAEVADFAVGDRVFGFVEGRNGGHAELVAVRANSLVATIPDGWSFAEAAPGMEGSHYALAFPRVVGTRPGDRVLVHGATGAIGSALVQILVADGVEVTAVVDQPLPRDLGASFEVVGPYDAVCDAVGKSSYWDYRHLLTERGSYTSSELGRGWQNPFLALVSRRVHFPLPKGGPEVAARIRDLMVSGAFRPLVDRTYPFEEIRDAYAYADSGRKVGSIVLRMAEAD
jgi:NADPH:quinone reductase-like Zn-dependent oxidoreductase